MVLLDFPLKNNMSKSVTQPDLELHTHHTARARCSHSATMAPTQLTIGRLMFTSADRDHTSKRLIILYSPGKPSQCTQPSGTDLL